MSNNLKPSFNHRNSLLQRGSIIEDKYEIEELLSCGVRTTLYSCRHVEINEQHFAIKILNPEYRHDPLAEGRFRAEVVASYGVNHFNVIRAFEFLEREEHLAYTMELVTGGNLLELAQKQSPIPISVVISLLSQFTNGLKAIHESGIAHRHLKPENILLTEDLEIKISDFSRAIFIDVPKKEDVGHIKHTQSTPHADLRSDLYCFGLIAYQLITGEAIRKLGIEASNYSRLSIKDFELPSGLRSDCPTALDEIVQKSLSNDPLAFYTDASQISADLKLLSSFSDGRINIRDSVALQKTPTQLIFDIDDADTIQLPELFRPSSTSHQLKRDNRFNKLRTTDTQVLRTLNDYLPATIPDKSRSKLSSMMRRILGRATNSNIDEVLFARIKQAAGESMGDRVASSLIWRSGTMWFTASVFIFILGWFGLDHDIPSDMSTVALPIDTTDPALVSAKEYGLPMFSLDTLPTLRETELSFLIEMLYNHSQENGRKVHPQITELIVAAIGEAARRSETMITPVYELVLRRADPLLRAKAARALIGSPLSRTDRGMTLLTSALQDQDYLVRGFTVKAIGAVGTYEALDILLRHKPRESHPVVKKLISQTIRNTQSASVKSTGLGETL